MQIIILNLFCFFVLEINIFSEYELVYFGNARFQPFFRQSIVEKLFLRKRKLLVKNWKEMIFPERAQIKV